MAGEIREKIKELSEDLESLNQLQHKTFAEYFQSLGLKFEESELKDFFKKPYILLPKAKQEWYCIVPAFINFQVGYFDRREGSYNIYIINKYSRWMNDIPEFMLEEIELDEPDKIYVANGELRFEENLLEKVRTKFGHRIKDLQKDKAKIKQGHEFELIAELIDEGNLPFIPKPIEEEDFREPILNFTTIGKYSFQEDVYKEFLKKGAVGVYWMTGAGKSFLAMKSLDSLDYDSKTKRKFLVTPTSTLVDQWKIYFEKYAPRLLEEVDILTYQSYHKIVENIKQGKKYICGVFDECDRLPADTFSRFATIDMKYRLGLSATPYREDGRTNYIFALTGYPFGLDWKSLIQILEKKLHPINIYILKSEQDKIKKITELLDLNKKTLIFSDSISVGKQISNKFNIPHIHGTTKKRLEVLEDNKVSVVSRVMDYGVSIKDLRHIIEVNFLFGSRKQQVQRTGRLLHSLSKNSRHDILFTTNEFNNYKKRLFGLMEKGFKLNFFNEATKDKIKVQEEDVRPLREIKMPEKKKEEFVPEPTTSIQHGNVDYETFLKNDTVQKLIKEAVSETAQKKLLKGALALIFQKKRPVSYEEIRKSLGLTGTTNMPSVVRYLEKYELVKKIKEGGTHKIDFNIEGINEIVELSKQREKSQGLIDDLFGEGK